MARAAGIHVILITQRPDRDVMPIQARENLGNRLALRVANENNASLIGVPGSDKLLPKGQLAANLPGEDKVIYAQVPYVPQEDLRTIADAIRTFLGRQPGLQPCRLGVSAMSSGVQAPPGKKVGGALYLHVDAVDTLPGDDRRAIDQAREIAVMAGRDHNVVKLGRNRRTVSLLTYAEFFGDPFPALVRAVSVDLATAEVATRTYDPNRNPPILHRKELLLPADHPSRAGFEALTRDLERANLYEQSAGIGHRKNGGAGFTQPGTPCAITPSSPATRPPKAIRTGPTAP